MTLKIATTLLILIMTAAQAQAIETQFCPRVISVMVATTSLPTLTQDALPAGKREEHFSKMLEVQDDFSFEPTRELKFNISFAGAGRCHYEGRDFLGELYQAKIQGSTKPGAKEPALLSINNESSTITIELKEVSRRGIESLDRSAILHYRIKTCSGTRCRVKNYPIGYADVDDLY